MEQRTKAGREEKRREELLVSQPGLCGRAPMVQHIVKELALISVLHHGRRAQSFTSAQEHRLGGAGGSCGSAFSTGFQK